MCMDGWIHVVVVEQLPRGMEGGGRRLDLCLRL